MSTDGIIFAITTRRDRQRMAIRKRLALTTIVAAIALAVALSIALL